MELFFPMFTAFFIDAMPVTINAPITAETGFETYEECMAFNMRYVAEYSYEMAFLFNQPAQGYITECVKHNIGDPA